MLDTFKTELEARERCFDMRAAGREERKGDQDRRNNTNSKQVSTVSTLHVDKDIIMCTYCQGKGNTAQPGVMLSPT